MQKETIFVILPWVRGERSGFGEVPVVVLYKGCRAFCRVVVGSVLG